MSKPGGLFRRSREEKSAMDGHFFNEEQLLDLENCNLREEEDTKDAQLEEIDVATWEKKNGFWVVPHVCKLEVLYQHHDYQMAGYWKRY